MKNQHFAPPFGRIFLELLKQANPRKDCDGLCLLTLPLKRLYGIWVDESHVATLGDGCYREIPIRCILV